jgi:menaquinone-specific isochorismate synthase
MSDSPGRLHAVRLELDPGPPLDPFALAGQEGIVFHSGDLVLVGLGEATAVPLPHGLDSTADLESAALSVSAVVLDDRHPQPVAGVVAFGALPFGRSDPGSLVIPELIYGTDAAGHEWVTVIAQSAGDLPADATGLRARLAARSHREPATPVRPTGVGTVSALPSERSFEAMVERALQAIEGGTVEKVVLSRQLDVELGAPVERVGLLRRWHQLEPNCTVFAMPTEDGQFFGASPELLIERTGPSIHSRPLAGTTDRLEDRSTRQGDPVLPVELLRSAKDGSEHRLVVEAIDASLRPLCSELTVPDRPDLIHFHNITHLGTSVTGTLAHRPDGSLPTALDLVGALHPTPAVGGVPRQRAVALIEELESEPRGHYAGPVGYLDGRGDGRWMLGIRSVSLTGTRARLAAGVGIVKGSVPTTELVETTLKFTAVLDALAPGVAADTGVASPLAGSAPG